MPNGRQDTIAEIQKILGEIKKKKKPFAPELELEEMPELTGLQRRLAQGQTVFLTPQYAKGMGFEGEFPEDWMMKVTPPKNGGQPAYSYISPEGKEVAEENLLTYPEGKWAEAVGQVWDYEKGEFVKASAEQIAEREQWPTEIAPEKMSPEEYNAKVTAIWTEKADLYKGIYPTLFEGYTEEQLPAFTQHFEKMLYETPETQAQFFEDVQGQGRTPETERLLKMLLPQLTEADLADFFGKPVAPPTAPLPKEELSRQLHSEGIPIDKFESLTDTEGLWEEGEYVEIRNIDGERKAFAAGEPTSLYQKVSGAVTGAVNAPLFNIGEVGVSSADLVALGLLAFGAYQGARALPALFTQVKDKALQTALNAGLDKWIAQRSRGVPAQKLKTLQDFLYNVIAKNKTWLQEKATENMLSRMGRGANKAQVAEQVVKETIDEFENSLLPKLTVTNTAVPGQKMTMAEIISGLQGTVPATAQAVQAGRMELGKTSSISNLNKGAWLQFKPEGRMYQIKEVGKTRTTVVDGEGNISTLPNSQQVYPLEPTVAPEPAVTPPEITKPTPVPKEIKDVIDKWGVAKSRNSTLAGKDLKALESKGYYIDDAKDALEEYKGIERTDYDDASDFADARSDAWDEFVGSLESIEGVEALPKAEAGMPEVLKDYPDLVKAPEPAVTPPETEKPITTPEVTKPKIELRKEQPNVSVIYRNGEPIGNFQFERVGKDKQGVNLRWSDPNTGEKQMIHFVGATEESINKNWQEIVAKHIPEVAIPKAEAGMPEAGLQETMLPGEVSAKEVRPKGKGRITQIRMDDQLKLAESQAEADTADILKDTEHAERDLQVELQRIETELYNRRQPYHGGGKGIPARNLFPNTTTAQLDARALKYKEALEKLKGEPPTPPIPPVAETPVPPPPENASRTVYERIQFEPEQEGFIDKVRSGWHRFNVKMVDDLFAIKKTVDQLNKGGVELSIEENPYLMARLLRGITGKANVFLEQGTFGKQFWKMEKGKAKPNFTGESLENILKEVKQPEVWRDFSTYLVARRAFDLSLRDIETGITGEEAAAAIGEQEALHPGFSELADRVYAYQDRLLGYAKESGLISDDLLGKLRQYGNYVPFYRVFNELQAKGLMGKKMADIASPIKKIKGSEREIINPLESIVKNTYVIINSADRNQIGIMLANLADKYPEITEVFERIKTPIARVAGVTAKELGVEIEGLSEAESEQVIDIFRPSFFTRGDEVTVLIDGKKNYFRVDSDLRDALLNLDRESLGMLGKILGAPARWLRAGATLSPDFMVRNPLRDQMTAFAYSNYGFLPGIDFLRGLVSIIAKDADYQLYRASGAEHSMLVSMDREYLQKSFKELTEGRGFTTYVKHPMELLRIISELGEKGTRLGEFKAGIRRGAVPLEAGYSSRSVTLDFSQMGTTAKAINTLIAFWNANIRGWGKMISSFKEHPTRTALKVFMGITLPSILLYLANKDDDRWKEIPQWQKDLFWIVMTPDNIYRIPKPFELGIIFGSMPERFLEWLDNKDPKLFKEALANLAEAGSPGFIPTIGIPILEWMTNYSFFKGHALVPVSREKMPPELQYTAWSSEFSKKIGELLKMPPAKIDNTINGWTGGLGRYAVNVIDEILKGTGISPDIPEPSPTLIDTPVIKAFVVRNPYGSSGQTVEDFYQKLEDYEQGEKYLKEMMESGEQGKFEEYKAKHPELLFFYELPEDPKKDGVFYSATARYLRRVGRQLTELRNKQDEVYKSKDISPEEKRRLVDEIDILKTDVARKALDLIGEGEPQVLQDSIDASIGRLGEVIEEPPVLSLEKPDIYTTRKLHTDFGNILEAVTSEELSKLEGIDPLASAYLGVKEIEKTVEPIPNKKIYEIKPDLKEGVSFEEYYQSWKQGIFEDTTLENLSRRQLDLLREYHKLDKPSQKQFLIDNPELKSNPHTDWLKANPKENAQLAIWGQAKILTMESYTEFNRLIKELDIPDSGIPEQTLPPDKSVENYFKYQDLIEERSANSWEVQKLMIEDSDLREFLKRDPIETPVEVLDLKIANRDLDPESQDYKDNEARIEAISNNGDPDKWVERGQTVDEFGGGSSEAKVWLLDNPDVHKWAIGQGLLTDDGSDWNEDVLRINVEMNHLEPESEEYKQLELRKEAYSKSPDYVDQYVEYHKLPIEGYRRERYLIDNPEFAKSVGLKIPDIVPSEKYDELLEKETKTPADILRMEGYKLYVPEEYIDRFVGYQSILDLGKPDNRFYRAEPDETYYEDTWYFIEHPRFYNDIYISLLGNDKKYWDKQINLTPTREVHEKYKVYMLDKNKGKEREDYRWENRDLDAWLLLTKKVTVSITGKRRRAALTPQERLAEELKEMEERLK